MQSSLRATGFTLIELLVVMAIIAMLLTLATPRYFASIERSKEAVLRESLRTMRDAIDKYYSDNGKYPDKLETLATRRYLRSVPVDPLTGSMATWIVIAAPDADTIGNGSVYDVRSGAGGTAGDGTPYKEW